MESGVEIKRFLQTAFLYLEKDERIEWYSNFPARQGIEVAEPIKLTEQVEPAPRAKPAPISFQTIVSSLNRNGAKDEIEDGDIRSWKGKFVLNKIVAYCHNGRRHLLRVLGWKDSRYCLFQPLGDDLSPIGKQRSIRITGSSEVRRRWSFLEPAKKTVTASMFGR